MNKLDVVIRFGSPVEFHRRMEMLDVIMLATGLGFFALLVGYGLACDGL